MSIIVFNLSELAQCVDVLEKMFLQLGSVETFLVVKFLLGKLKLVFIFIIKVVKLLSKFLIIFIREGLCSALRIKHSEVLTL